MTSLASHFDHLGDAFGLLRVRRQIVDVRLIDALLVDQFLVAERVAVVEVEDDDGVLVGTRVFEFIEDQADLPVKAGDVGVPNSIQKVVKR